MISILCRLKKLSTKLKEIEPYIPERPLQEYLQIDPWAGDTDVDLKAQTVKIVRTRKEHWCNGCSPGCGHLMKKGTYAYLEHAIVDGEWGSCYCCLKCMDETLDLMDTQIEGIESSFKENH